INAITGDKPMYTVADPTSSDPRLGATMVTPEGKVVPKYKDASGAIKMLPSFLFWCVFLFAFSYLGANLPIWRFAQPVNYIGFWVTALTIGLSALGAILGGVLSLLGDAEALKTVTFTTPTFAGFMGKMKIPPGQTLASLQPLWPMLFVTIACGAISGWHSLVGSIGTARQLEYETDALPVGGGGMFSENALALLSLIAVSIAGGERNLDLPVAVVRCFEPVDGGIEPADRQSLAEVGGTQPALRLLAHAVHVCDHHGSHLCDRLQPLRQHSVESEDCDAAHQQ